MVGFFFFFFAPEGEPPRHEGSRRWINMFCVIISAFLLIILISCVLAFSLKQESIDNRENAILISNVLNKKIDETWKILLINEERIIDSLNKSGNLNLLHRTPHDGVFDIKGQIVNNNDMSHDCFSYTDGQNNYSIKFNNKTLISDKTGNFQIYMTEKERNYILRNVEFQDESPVNYSCSHKNDGFIYRVINREVFSLLNNNKHVSSIALVAFYSYRPSNDNFEIFVYAPSENH